MFYSLLFAMGGAPTIAMMMIKSQQVNPDVLYQIFIGLTIMIACVLVPVMLLQNAYLFFKRKDERLEQKIIPLRKFYLLLNAGCLVFWLYIQFSG